MVERRDLQNTTETKIAQIYERIDILANQYGVDFSGGGKKAIAVLNTGLSDVTSCITVSLFTGHVKGETKAIYKNEKINGGIERIEYSFREDGSFEKRVLRDRKVNSGMSVKSRSSMEEVLRVKRINSSELDDLNTLLNSAEAEFGRPEREALCEDGFYPIPARPKHKHLISVKRKVNLK